ncbi:MAG: HAD hydrolase-like protein [Deltaproteobacteria bacterium]|nr:HAD hydrolase-like protein [Deltaproteobacteria bacterium]
MRIKALVFDLENTLIQKRELDAESKPAPGVGKLLQYLEIKDLRLALLSSGSSAECEKLLEILSEVSETRFDEIISRKGLQVSGRSTNAVRLATRKLNLPPQQVLVVTANSAVLREAQSAGTATVFFDQSAGPGAVQAASTYQISNLDQLKGIVRLSTPLPTGKLPNDLLREFLNQFEFDDPAILINPGVGEDTAAVDVESEEVLVLKSDPITFATDAIGQYAVLINANDIATSGAKPRWLLTTLLFPYGVTPSEIHQVIKELKEFCRRWEITLCGGHTEITDAVTRPVVTGMMAGTVARRNLIESAIWHPEIECC